MTAEDIICPLLFKSEYLFLCVHHFSIPWSSRIIRHHTVKANKSKFVTHNHDPFSRTTRKYTSEIFNDLPNEKFKHSIHLHNKTGIGFTTGKMGYIGLCSNITFSCYTASCDIFSALANIPACSL